MRTMRSQRQEIDGAQCVADQNASGVLFARMHRIFEIEDDGVGTVQRGVDEVLRLAARERKDANGEAITRDEGSGSAALSGRTRVPSAETSAPCCCFDAGGNHEWQCALVMDLRPAHAARRGLRALRGLAPNRFAVVGLRRATASSIWMPPRIAGSICNVESERISVP